MVTSSYEWKILEWGHQLQTNKQDFQVCVPWHSAGQENHLCCWKTWMPPHHTNEFSRHKCGSTKFLPCSSEKEERPRRSFICQIGVVRSYSLVVICLVWAKADLFCLERPKRIQKVFSIWSLVTYFGERDLLE